MKKEFGPELKLLVLLLIIAVVFIIAGFAVE
jgi:hypothetical protein